MDIPRRYVNLTPFPRQTNSAFFQEIAPLAKNWHIRNLIGNQAQSGLSVDEFVKTCHSPDEAYVSVRYDKENKISLFLRGCMTKPLSADTLEYWNATCQFPVDKKTFHALDAACLKAYGYDMLDLQYINNLNSTRSTIADVTQTATYALESNGQKHVKDIRNLGSCYVINSALQSGSQTLLELIGNYFFERIRPTATVHTIPTATQFYQDTFAFNCIITQNPEDTPDPKTWDPRRFIGLICTDELRCSTSLSSIILLSPSLPQLAERNKTIKNVLERYCRLSIVANKDNPFEGDAASPQP